MIYSCGDAAAQSERRLLLFSSRRSPLTRVITGKGGVGLIYQLRRRAGEAARQRKPAVVGFLERIPSPPEMKDGGGLFWAIYIGILMRLRIFYVWLMMIHQLLRFGGVPGFADAPLVDS